MRLRREGYRVSWAVILLVGSAAGVQGDRSEDGEMADVASALNEGRTPAAATLDRIMEQAVRNIAVRYKLNEGQRDMTDQLMKREVKRFLIEHENEVWPVIGNLLRTQFGTHPPDDRELVKQIGRMAGPLVKAAEKYILEANQEWREILTPEQRTVHDFDLKDMKRQFQIIEENFESWAGGTPTPEIFPRAQTNGRQPPPPSDVRDVLPVRSFFDPSRILAAIVEEFTREHKLDKGQITTARSILEEFKSKANDYRNSKKREFAAAVKETEAAHQRRDLGAVKKAAKAHKELLKPVYVLCDQMQDRLMSLLTTAQRQRHREKDSDGAVKTSKSPSGKAAGDSKTAQTPSSSSDSVSASDGPGD